MPAPLQYNHRNENGPGGLNLTTLTPQQAELVKLWSKIGHKSNLPYMLLNHMTEEEQGEMVRVYQMVGLIGADE